MGTFLQRHALQSDVEAAYRLILGREPESRKAVLDHLVDNPTIEQMREAFLYSPEFADVYRQNGQNPTERLGSVAAIALDNEYEPMQVEYKASSEELNAIIAHIEKVWSDYGEKDPYFSVITSKDFLNENLTAAAIDRFYKSGEDTALLIEKTLRRCSVWERVKGKTCLEFGCGLGRVTTHLVKRFSRVHGVDISKKHLRVAETAVKTRAGGGGEFQFTYTPKIDSILSLGKFDFIFTVIVLQHNPPPIIAKIIDAFFNLLNPGGVCMFQVPVRIRNYSFSIKKYIKEMNAITQMEAHPLPQKAIFEMATANGCVPLEVQCDGWNGSPDVVSQTFVFEKTR